jgi:clan AA aspartic protease (TIGR02281 family)
MSRLRGGIALALLFVLSVAASHADLDGAGRTAYARGDYAAAERAFSEAISRAPTDALLRYHRAGALMQLGRWNEAVDEYERVLQLRPSEQLALATRGALKSLVPLTRRTAPSTGGDRDMSTIRMDRSRGGWIADVVLNDARRARFLVDTGASVTVLSPELADALGIVPSPNARTMRLQTLAGQTEAPLVAISSLRLGELEARDVIAVIHDTVGLDGILGNTFLARYTVTLDARQGLLTVRRR